jgi:hypothetical protein
MDGATGTSNPGGRFIGVIEVTAAGRLAAVIFTPASKAAERA